MDIVIEKAAPTDIEAVSQLMSAFKLETQSLSNDFDKLKVNYEEIIRKEMEHLFLNNDAHILISRNAGKIAGFIIGRIIDYLPIYEIEKMGYIPELYVVPEFRRNGIAQKLISEMEAWFRQCGMKYSKIETICQYTINKDAYANCGYDLFLYDLRKSLY